MDSRVLAIREHKLIGRGSCTSIDECWEDGEILSWLDENHITTDEGSVEWALSQEGLWLESGLNQRWGADDDPQLLAWQKWNEELKGV